MARPEKEELIEIITYKKEALKPETMYKCIYLQ